MCELEYREVHGAFLCLSAEGPATTTQLVALNQISKHSVK